MAKVPFTITATTTGPSTAAFVNSIVSNEKIHANVGLLRNARVIHV